MRERVIKSRRASIIWHNELSKKVIDYLTKVLDHLENDNEDDTIEMREIMVQYLEDETIFNRLESEDLIHYFIINEWVMREFF
ncbi:MAG: hypothetical protein ACTSQF_01975 [Candidatus Heimdallarchaeaceae archaeon]